MNTTQDFTLEYNQVTCFKIGELFPGRMKTFQLGAGTDPVALIIDGEGAAPDFSNNTAPFESFQGLCPCPGLFRGSAT